MALGPGKYDDVCTRVRGMVGLTELPETGGGVMLIVVGGDKGDGFACQSDLVTLLTLADYLENVARQIREHGVGGNA